MAKTIALSSSMAAAGALSLLISSSSPVEASAAVILDDSLIPFVKSVANKKSDVRDAATDRRGNNRFLLDKKNPRSISIPTFLGQHRRFQAKTSNLLGDTPKMQEACDAAFLTCLPHTKCVGCFATLQSEGIDWASVTPETPCVDVVSFLTKGGHCKDLGSDEAEKDVFCNTFNSCVVWDDDTPAKKKSDDADANNETGEDDAEDIDCDSLKECKWEGMHEGFLGDGICHDWQGCYNHEICGFDKGDCCAESCEKNKNKNKYTECGVDPYACRDPKSPDCDPTLTDKCENPSKEKDEEDEDAIEDCGPDETPYRVAMYDSWGDGWDSTILTITEKDDKSKVIFEGGLKEGAEGTEYVCLASDPTCYSAKVNGGVWGNEVSWEVKPISAGTPSVADGGSPMDCEFSVGGEVCLRTCDGKPDTKINDPNYKTYKALASCIQDKCLIQVGSCQADSGCKDCLSDRSPTFCFANENYNALVDCALCRCVDEKPAFCEDKSVPGSKPQTSTATEKAAKETGTMPKCSADQTLTGAAAVMAFSECTDFDEIAMMITDFDENNFGALDTFEACSHAFKDDTTGAKKAIDCMRILHNAMGENADADDDETESKPSTTQEEAASALAEKLYKDAEHFCGCASKATEDCPACESFVHFKTLLYETLDACKSLDEIDCDAWNEFYGPCKNNMMEMYSTVDFGGKQERCDYVKNGCGGAGPFPAFRKLDCGHEIPKQAWDFYTTYERDCLKSDSGKGGSTPVPVPNPSTPPPTAAKKEKKEYIPTDGKKPKVDDKKTYYVPPDDEDHHSDAHYVPEEQQKSKKKGHPFLVFVAVCGMAGVGYWYHKKRSDSFDFMRYRRQNRNYGGDSDVMYSGLTDSGASSFEPPTLPPTPSAMDGNMMA